MKNKITAILLVAVFVVAFLVFYKGLPAVRKTSVISEKNQQTNNSQKWETKTDEQEYVTVVVTPLDLSSQSVEWKFFIVMDTHSIELDQDMIKSVILIDDPGKEYKPVSWEGPTGGHHREGVLKFKAITPAPKSVELKISNIGSVVRSLSWQFK